MQARVNRVNLRELAVPKKVERGRPCSNELLALLTCVEGDNNDLIKCRHYLQMAEECFKLHMGKAARQAHKPTDNFHLLRLARLAGIVKR